MSVVISTDGRRHNKQLTDIDESAALRCLSLYLLTDAVTINNLRILTSPLLWDFCRYIYWRTPSQWTTYRYWRVRCSEMSVVISTDGRRHNKQLTDIDESAALRCLSLYLLTDAVTINNLRILTSPLLWDVCRYIYWRTPSQWTTYGYWRARCSEMSVVISTDGRRHNERLTDIDEPAALRCLSLYLLTDAVTINNLRILTSPLLWDVCHYTYWRTPSQ